MEKWDYEKVSRLIDSTIELYFADVYDFAEKEKLQNRIWEMSGWTYDEFMTECEKRMSL
jgi:hypothetical protein